MKRASAKYAACCAGLVVLTLCVYSNSFPGTFHYDDFGLMLESETVTAPTFNYMLFLENYGGRPLTLWTFHVNHQWAGAEPLTFHMVSLLLHLGVGLLLYTVSLNLGLSGIQAILISVLFLVHPIQSQAVNYIWARSVLLMSFFCLVSVHLVRKRPAMALVFFQLALWSRIDALLLAPLLGLLRPRLWRWVWPIATLNLTATLLGLYRHQPSNFALSHPDPWGYWLQQPAALWRFWELLVWPSGFSLVHDLSRLSWITPALLLGSLCGLILIWRRRHPESVGWRAFGVAGLFLLPAMLIPNSEPFSESRAYLPVAAVIVGLVSCVPAGTLRRPLSLVGISAIVLFLAFLTRERNQLWQDDVLVWRDAVTNAPASVLARYNLGSALAQRGDCGQARRAFLQVLRLNPFDDLGYSGLGYCAEVAGASHVAKGHYRRALDLNVDNTYARQALSRLGDTAPPLPR